MAIHREIKKVGGDDWKRVLTSSMKETDYNVHHGTDTSNFMRDGKGKGSNKGGGGGGKTYGTCLFC